MKYIGDLYGKLGRKYIKLRISSEDVDAMEENLQIKDELINHLHEVIFKMNENKPFVIPGPMVVNPDAKAFPSPDNNFNQMGPPITSFKFDQPWTEEELENAPKPTPGDMNDRFAKGKQP